MRSLTFYMRFLCSRRACALRYATVKVFLSKNRLPQSSILYKRKKGVSNDTNTKERVSVPTDILIISYTFSFVSPFLKKIIYFFTEKDNPYQLDCPSLFLIHFNTLPYFHGWETIGNKLCRHIHINYIILKH